MGQSERGYVRDLLERARSDGGRACREGASSAINPYLQRDFMPSQSGVSEQAWFSACEAWWRGWDDEDERRRGLRERQFEATRPLRGSGFERALPEGDAN